ncbi:DUF4123 domain-containing protein [Pseudomonas sp. NUPR-001]|uniref:DUF4123 domain-containing protein n=1 Tax=Pseudomonas sp. NUPR-001 TaxID=3416058 RepID=UPI003F972144
MHEMPPLPHDLPWATPAYLLLDGVSLPGLQQHLHPWSNSVYCLYRHTRWHELCEISPCLVVLNGRDDPLLAHFQQHAAREWGYLLFSDVEAFTLCKHWRHLLSVEQAEGVEVMPRIADPAVMQPLFAMAEQAHSARWFGPVSHVCLPDGVQGCWWQYTQAAQANAEPKRYRLTDEELTALGNVEFRTAVSAVSEHLHLHFPAFLATQTAAERRQSVHSMMEEAYQLGFCSDQELTLYANVHGYLAGQPISEDIVQLLTQSTPDTPLTRVKRAAELAERRATERQGSLS